MWSVFLLLLTVSAIARPAGWGVADDISRITISTPSGWHLTIRPDGSATYGFGSGGGPILESGTFDFEDVLRRLQQSLTEKGGLKTHYGVSLRRGEERTTRAKYTKDAETIRALFDTARQATKGPIPRQDELWERKPPVPHGPVTRPSTQPSTTRATTQPAPE